MTRYETDERPLIPKHVQPLLPNRLLFRCSQHAPVSGCSTAEVTVLARHSAASVVPAGSGRPARTSSSSALELRAVRERAAVAGRRASGGERHTHPRRAPQRRHSNCREPALPAACAVHAPLHLLRADEVVAQVHHVPEVAHAAPVRGQVVARAVCGARRARVGVAVRAAGSESRPHFCRTHQNWQLADASPASFPGGSPSWNGGTASGTAGVAIAPGVRAC